MNTHVVTCPWCQRDTTYPRYGACRCTQCGKPIEVAPDPDITVHVIGRKTIQITLSEAFKEAIFASISQQMFGGVETTDVH